ncbi:amino acid adenylation domain-containing protein [uncultured Fibrella sp.]|uniref:amino acid adenylation domain-containing protein n=1 Tax=uncultured Fibrella sp. TaxID=1284596 RepID=UPI0035CBD80E
MPIDPLLRTPLTNEPEYTVDRLVDTISRSSGQSIAVVFDGNSLTYSQLDAEASQVAQLLLRTAPDADLIGISTTRRVSLVSQILGILKAGKAYLPLDPSYPPTRLQQIIDSAQLTHCLADVEEADLYEQFGVTVPTEKPDTTSPLKAGSGSPTLSVTKQNPVACILYTSGSTGIPKGVCLGHAGLIDLLRWQAEHGTAQPGTRALQFCHLSFDASFQEIFVPLTTGGTVYLIDDSYRLDAARLLRFIADNAINRVFLPYVVLQYMTEAAERLNLFPATLQEVITGGERLRITPQIRRFFTELPESTLMNVYGPTETSVWVTEHKLKGDAQNWPALPPIGTPIANADIVLLTNDLTLVENGQVGELYVGGPCVALGYLNRPDLTAERFLRWTHPEKGDMVIYRTGDLASYSLSRPGGVTGEESAIPTLDFMGRGDDQVKIRGNRVELGEIEVALAHLPGVQQAVAVAQEGASGQKTLLTYVIVDAGSPIDGPTLRHKLSGTLPDFMLPAQVIVVDTFPRTTSGKVDKLALPRPEPTRPSLATIFREPGTSLEQQIADFWADLLEISPVGADDNFFDLGGNSLLAQKTVAFMDTIGQTLPITKLYQYPTVAGLAAFLQPANSPAATAQPIRQVRQRDTSGGDIAVIGMAGRFPGANSIDELWQVLTEGRETTRFFTPDELDPSIPAQVRSSPAYVRARGVLAQADQFDPAFFGLTPALADLMDPQQRVFLEIAYEALEQTGYLPQLAGPARNEVVGVWAGCGNNTYFLNNVLPNPAAVDRVGAFQAMTVNEKDYIASRTAYQLNLKGPAVSVYSACSTSLLAITQAVDALRNGQCTVALAGGAAITAPVNSGHFYEEGAMLSRTGQCRSFDADASGTVFSDGAGVVLLKPLDAAQRDGDLIFAVIKGVGVSNDGGGKGSFTAPNAEGQAAAIRQAQADAQVDPATISYVEAHGTATPLGDPIEFDGLTMAFGPQQEKQFCALGSIKSNMGHLTQAAGVAALIKTVLALLHQKLPASLHFERPNPAIDFANSPFFVNTTLTNWPAGELPRRAGVSSFGVGGTNVHVVLEEAPVVTPEPIDKPSSERPYQILTWSARSVASREAYAARLGIYLQRPATPTLSDVAFTLQTTRPAMGNRRFVVAAEPMQASNALLEQDTNTHTLNGRPGEVVFVFPGQGAQYLGMGHDFYKYEPVYRDAIDVCAELLAPHLDVDIRSVMYPETADLTAKELLKNTRYTQPALFVTNYALAQLWQSWGIAPTVLCGHSVGEFVAAHLAGVFSLPDALRLIAMRGQLVGSCPRGSMLSVRRQVAEVEAMLPGTLSVAAINSHTLCVVAGSDEDIAAFAQYLDQKSIPNRVLETSHAFHSAMMDPVIPTFTETVRQVTLSRPQKPIVSTVTGTWLTDQQATDPGYWAGHLRQTVRFADALDTILALRNPLLLEVGPGNSSTTLARQQAGSKSADKRSMTAVASLHRPDEQTDYQALLSALGTLWLQGVEPNWSAFYANRPHQLVQLPTYAFDRKRCWVDPPAGAVPLIPTQGSQAGSTGESAGGTFAQNQFAQSIDYQPVLVQEVSPQSAPTQLMRSEHLLNQINTLLEDASGIDLAGTSPTTSFLEIGLDSLLLTQVSISLRRTFGVPITFRQLSGEFDNPQKLATYLDAQLPADAHQPAPVAASALSAAPVAYASQPVNNQPIMTQPGGDSALGLIAQQLQILAKQVALMQGGTVAPAPAVLQPAAVVAVTPASAPTASAAPKLAVSLPTADITPEEAVELKKPFGATARIDRQITGLTEPQKQFLAELTTRYNQKTASSKAYTQQHRAQMADPRVVSGFRPLTKEIVYPLVINKSKGSRLWDLDGNEYIDALNGFGATMFGHQPDFIKEALHEQVENGYEVGPQHELAGEVCQLVCEFTKFDRAALCSTGSEAVLGTMRVARTVTGRSLIVAFTGSYHGIVDEVLVRGTKKLKTFPAAAGIMPEAVQNMLILDYGTDESLRIIRERAHELAAVLVEPVQSRRPEFRPIEFLKEVRAITEASGTALIFDEVITGFRMHLGGAQALFGIQADLASYGKVIGGGLPIGVIAGKKAFMDALDGGFWQYGDDSFPEVGVTYFAGTFVRHPLALASAKASLLHLQAESPSLQKRLTRYAEQLATAFNARFDRQKLPIVATQFGSLWRLKWTEDVAYGELLFTMMREKGIHIWDGFPCFITEAHTDADITTIREACLSSIDAMISAGFLTPGVKEANNVPGVWSADHPPVPGARLGRDQSGNPAWFIADPDNPGAYRQLEIEA